MISVVRSDLMSYLLMPCPSLITLETTQLSICDARLPRNCSPVDIAQSAFPRVDAALQRLITRTRVRACPTLNWLWGFPAEHPKAAMNDQALPGPRMSE